MLTMPTFCSGKAGFGLAGTVQPGPMATSQIVTRLPPTRDATAPHVLNRFQNRVNRMAGRLAAVRMAGGRDRGAEFGLAGEGCGAEGGAPSHEVEGGDQGARSGDRLA